MHHDRREGAIAPSLNRRRLVQRAAAIAAAIPVLGLALGARRGEDAPSVRANLFADGAATPGASPAASPGAGSVAAVTVRMTSQLRFDPNTLTIKVGTTVTWHNASSLPHTATCDPAQNPVTQTHPDYIVLPAGAQSWGSPLLPPGEAWSHTFIVAGEYHYLCIPHVLSGMRATIDVRV